MAETFWTDPKLDDFSVRILAWGLLNADETYIGTIQEISSLFNRKFGDVIRSILKLEELIYIWVKENVR